MKGHASWCWTLALLGGCHTAGSDWMSQPLPGADDPWASPAPEGAANGSAPPRGAGSALGARQGTAGGRAAGAPSPAGPSGRVLGRFRNTYYDFPSETEFTGKPVALMNESCKPIKQVPQEFHDAVCVQGSGHLSTGATVSFARRNCECARVCPRTEQKICFEELSAESFPWGRGALGQPITPLLTVAVDDAVIPMHTVLYVPEFDGLPRDATESAFHDGCFLAQDRGLKVKGQHIDVFTGQQVVTALWNRLVPSNQGVTVVLDAPRCSRLGGARE